MGDPVDVDKNEDDDVLTYSFVTDDSDNPDASAVDAGFFSINKASGQISVAKRLSAEAIPGDGRTYGENAASAGKYVVVVRATDPSGEEPEEDEEDRDDITVTITANDVNEAPTVRGMAELSVNEADSSNKNYYVGLGDTLETDESITRSDPDNTENLYHRSEEDRVDRAIWPEPIAGLDGHLFEYSTPAGRYWSQDSLQERAQLRRPAGR